ncbi:MAG: DUF4266 domain-containing protein [Bacteroidetes bacterium]|nr:DUF4266 domain-containing protein [Bacteroidota bacterium]
MSYYNALKRSSIVLAVVFLMASCSTVMEYQKVYLNDSDMELNNRLLEEFETNFQSYKEGAVGGNNGNGGAGCGCN